MWQPDLDGVISTLAETDFPLEVLVETTAHCNLRCSMCPQKDMKREKGEISFELFKKIVDEMAQKSPESRLWLAIMGEALLLGNKLIEMIKYAKVAGIKSIHLNTNANLLNKEMSLKLIESGIDEIIIGMDAFTKDTYEKIRVGGDFHKTRENVEFLLSEKRQKQISRPKVIMQFIVMQVNENELDDYKSYWLSRGAIIKVRPKIGWGTAVETEDLTLPDSYRTFPCPMIIRNIAIHWDGTVANCSDADYEGLYPAGNINDSTIEEIWNGELATRRKKHWEGDFSHPLCKSCKDWQTGRSIFYFPENYNEQN